MSRNQFKTKKKFGGVLIGYTVYFQDCPMVCRQNKECVQCVAYGTGLKKDNCKECKNRNYITVEDVLSG